MDDAKDRGSALARLLIPELDPADTEALATLVRIVAERVIVHLAAWDGSRSRLLRGNAAGELLVDDPGALALLASIDSHLDDIASYAMDTAAVLQNVYDYENYALFTHEVTP